MTTGASETPYAPPCTHPPHSANHRSIRIAPVKKDPTVLFAAAELERYLRRITGSSAVHIQENAYNSHNDTHWSESWMLLQMLSVPQLKTRSLMRPLSSRSPTGRASCVIPPFLRMQSG